MKLVLKKEEQAPTQEQPVVQKSPEVIEEILPDIYFIVHIESHHTEMYGKQYSSRARAEAARKRMKKRNGEQKYPDSTHKVMSLAEYREGNTLVEVVNMMSGKKTMIPKSIAGTSCDPSTERYWSM